MERFTVTLDGALLEQARQALGTKTKRETIAVALLEASRLRQLRRTLEHRGKVDLGLTRKDLLRRRRKV